MSEPLVMLVEALDVGFIVRDVDEDESIACADLNGLLKVVCNKISDVADIAARRVGLASGVRLAISIAALEKKEES